MQPTEIVLATYSSQQKKTVVIRNHTAHNIVIKVVRDDSVSVPFKGLYYLASKKFIEVPVTIELAKLKASSAVSFYVRNVIQNNASDVKNWLLLSNNELRSQLAARMKLTVSKDKFSSATVILDINDGSCIFEHQCFDDTKTCKEIAEETNTADDFHYEDFEPAVVNKLRKSEAVNFKLSAASEHCEFFQSFLNTVFLPARANA